ncbi:MAG: RluA family pseudouridine synthase [Phycisphaerae bacterium]|nr:RluA family pseudouridine synthase [Phycisphaerae bacterium]
MTRMNLAANNGIIVGDLADKSWQEPAPMALNDSQHGPDPVGSDDDALVEEGFQEDGLSSDDEVVIKRTDPQDDDEPRQVRLVIRRKLPGRRLDKYLHGRFRRLSRTTIQRLIKRGDILVNGKPTKNSYEMEGGDVIDVAVPPPEPYDVIPEDIPLDIVYEDDFVLAINKAVGMVVHPASRTQTGTVANALSYYCKTLAKTDDPFRPGIVHRLDKNTSGIMIVAKTDEAHWRLALQFEQRKTQKIYVAVVHGNPEFDEDIIDVPIGQHPTVHDRYVATGFAERMGGRFEKKLSKEAVTRYRVVERFSGYSLVHLFPKTGRTHQLRIHMSHIRHPIVGDPFYGGRHVSIREVTGRPEDPGEPRFTRQMLHAHRLSVTHPIHETPLELEAPLAPDMAELLTLLRQHATITTTIRRKRRSR